MTDLALDTPELARQYEDLSDKQFTHGKLLLTDLALAPGERVLDIGCGTGRLAEYAAALVGPAGLVVGVDPLPLRIRIAQAKARANLSFAVTGAENLSLFGDAAFDAAYFNSVFHWIEGKPAALAEAARVLKPGGRLGISVADKANPHSLQKVVGEVLSLAPFRQHGGAEWGGPLFKISTAEAIALLEAAGFAAVSIEAKTFVDYFDDAQTVIDFSASSAFGNFLGHLPAELKTYAIANIKSRLEHLRTPKGIELHRHLLFTFAIKR